MDGKGLEAVRSDTLSESGIITTQIINLLYEAPLVVADLTGRNPNVYYELAIRHSIAKPFVQFIAAEEVGALPFDINSLRTIPIDIHDLDSAARARMEFERQVDAFEPGGRVETPVSFAAEVRRLRESADPEEHSIADVLTGMEEIKTALSIVLSQTAERRVVKPEGVDPADDLGALLDAINVSAKLGLLPPSAVTRWITEVNRAHLARVLAITLEHIEDRRKMMATLDGSPT